ncbi:MAG TPA: alpha/beta hydrolase [Verrucomicrobiales bacterium]|nr:alpha/beta hydrolase [Verrucomicrobiales bacterium]
MGCRKTDSLRVLGGPEPECVNTGDLHSANLEEGLREEPGPALLAGLASMDRNQLLLDQAQSAVYKEVNGAALRSYIFRPSAEWHGAGARPACVFFSSGLWDQNLVSQFAPYAVYLAGRGMVSLLCEYRQRTLHGTSPAEAILDARSAVRWTRIYAEELGIDSERIAAAGGSGGGHIALCSALLEGEGWDETGEPVRVTARPDLLLLFNPVVDTSRRGVGAERFRSPVEAEAANPFRWIARGLPPSLILHGSADRVVPVDQVERFSARMRKKKNVCRLEVFEGRGHGFFNLNVSVEDFELSLVLLHDFLATHGFIARDVEEVPHGSWLESRSG